MLFIGADHGGWNLKEVIKKWLKSKKIKFEDVGAKVLVQDDDYPDFALPLARKVARAKKNLGILIGRSGIEMSFAADKIKGIRAALCNQLGQTITARAHNNCNVLVLGADFIEEEQALKIVEMFLKAEFSEEERYLRRLEKVAKIEK